MRRLIPTEERLLAVMTEQLIASFSRFFPSQELLPWRVIGYVESDSPLAFTALLCALKLNYQGSLPADFRWRLTGSIIEVILKQWRAAYQLDPSEYLADEDIPPVFVKLCRLYIAQRRDELNIEQARLDNAAV